MSDQPTNDASPAGDGLLVHGATWCGDTKRSRALLDRLGIAYTFIDIDKDEAAGQWVERHNGGSRSIPVIVIPGGETLTEPSNEDLEKALQSAGMVS
ncbi:MAG: glutaredoxin family protein [Chloroflexota bacterium]|nr:glutaredoxin family protein [Chloroflexota bacterium]